MAGNLPISSILNHHRLLLDAASTTSTSPDTSTFDATMVIILAALLCALVCALGLNSIIRCIIRCTRRLALMEPADEEAVARFAAARGMKNRGGCSIRSMIPVAVYGVDSVKVVGGADCSICLGEFVDGEKIRVLPRCSHGFHVRCIDAWLVSHSSCPTCRRSLAEDGRGAQPPDEAGGGRREEEERITVDE